MIRTKKRKKKRRRKKKKKKRRGDREGIRCESTNFDLSSSMFGKRSASAFAMLFS